MAAYIAWLHDDVKHESPSIDYVGAILFAAAVGALMFALSGVGTSYEREALVAAVVFVVLSVAFVFHERRVTDPMVSFELWRRRAIATANLSSLLASVALMGLTVFLPMYVQIVLQRSPIVAGFALTTMILGWPLGATIAAHTFHRFGLRNTLIAGSALVPLGALFFVTLTPQSSPIQAAIGSFMMGLGMGLLSTSCLVLIQEAAGAAERGSATASNLFSRNLGSALGATVFGVVVNLGLAGTSVAGRVTADDLKRLLEASGTAAGSNQQLLATIDAALHTMFVAMLAVSVLLVVVALFVPNQWFRRVRKGSREAGRTA
jgi:MFS family permease